MNSEEELKIEHVLNAKVLAVANIVVVRENMLILDMGNRATSPVPGVLAPEFASSAKGKAIIKGVKSLADV